VLLLSFLYEVRHNNSNSNLNMYLALKQYHFCNANLRSVSSKGDYLDLSI
jgi:hypothetical protein